MALGLMQYGMVCQFFGDSGAAQVTGKVKSQVTVGRYPPDSYWLFDIVGSFASWLFSKKYFPTDGGDDKLRTSVYPSTLAPIGAKLWQRAFRKICKF